MNMVVTMFYGIGVWRIPDRVCVCVCVCALYFGYVCIYVVSSPYLLVFGDDRVIRYMGVDDVTGGAGEV